MDRVPRDPSSEVPHDPSYERLVRLLHEVAHASHNIPSTHYRPAEGLNTCTLVADGGEAYTYRANQKGRTIAIRVMKHPSDKREREICHEVCIVTFVQTRLLRLAATSPAFSDSHSSNHCMGTTES